MFTYLFTSPSGETICTRFISGVVSNYVELGITAEDNSKPATHLHIYRDHLEVSFLEETEGFYVSESAHFLQQNPVTEYIKRIDVSNTIYYNIPVIRTYWL